MFPSFVGKLLRWVGKDLLELELVLIEQKIQLIMDSPCLDQVDGMYVFSFMCVKINTELFVYLMSVSNFIWT